MGESNSEQANLRQIALSVGVIFAIFLLVLALYPLILKRSPLGDVVRDAEIASALSEMQEIVDAFDKILDDLGGPENFADLWAENDLVYAESVSETVVKQTLLLYKLFRSGSNAEVGLDEDSASRLSESYIDLGNDPWGRQYRLYIGPWVSDRHDDYPDPPFVSYWRRAMAAAPEGLHPSPDLKLYVYSLGPDGISSQPFSSGYDGHIAGDDIGLWEGIAAAP